MRTLTFNTFLQQSPLNLALQGQGSIYLAPNIPDKKLVGAQHYLPKHVQPNQVIILIDDTVFGSAKIGLCITEQGLYYKADFEELVYCSWQHIHSIDTDIGMINRNIMINQQLKLNFTQLERQAIQAIADLINAFIRQRNETSDTRPHGTQQRTVSLAMQSALQLLTYISAQKNTTVHPDDWGYIEMLSIYGEEVQPYIETLKTRPVTSSKQVVFDDLVRTEYAYDREFKSITFEYMLRLLIVNDYSIEDIIAYMNQITLLLKVNTDDTQEIYARIREETQQGDLNQQYSSFDQASQHFKPQLTAEQQQACQLLGINDQQIDATSLKHAYRKKMAEFHPDQYQQLPESVRLLIEQQAQQLNHARDILEKCLRN
ncbi:hypothetical protein C3F34_11565 [Acinetobacter sp. ACNIH2]|uniref:J domain-containing protein n=1 Tax=Acinetobacter sp. ACNIH2 TaxID=1758189 RepID=UPI000CDCC929|nr:hypothetical protein [Acinetobacter sp. ACNIH2]AUX86611.1 hypothetical protein C3F34_11565 [Acinetobacter sp. ACNIH2]